MTELEARRPMTYGNRRLRAGERFTATDAHARLLVALRRAVLASPHTAAIAVEPAPIATPDAAIEPATPRVRRVYKRRDLRPEA